MSTVPSTPVNQMDEEQPPQLQQVECKPTAEEDKEEKYEWPEVRKSGGCINREREFFI